jgi:hypothetical protein
LVALWLSVMTASTLAAEGSRSGLAFGLNGITDWSTQHPFIDVMKTARPWIGHLPGQWGGVEFASMLQDGVFDEHGWPRRIPKAVTKLETVILTEQPAKAMHLEGRYHLLYEGEGELSVTGPGRVVRREPGLRVFTYRPGSRPVGISISSTDANDPIRNIRIVHEDHLQAFDEGQLFNPLWLSRIEGVAVIRFLDWMNTNNSRSRNLADLPKRGDFSYAWRGVPLPVMIALANRLNADPWFTLPHLGDDDLVRHFARTVHANLDSDLRAHVEYSNEVWNFIFDQARWAQEQAQARWGEADGGWMQFYGLRAAEVMQIWSDVYGPAAPDRLRRVVSVHTGWPELEQSVLYGKNAEAALGFPPAAMFDAYAVTGYFGYELGDPNTLQDALDMAEQRAEAAGRAEGLSRVALREYMKEHRFDGVARQAERIVRDGSFKELTGTLWPYHASAAREAGLDLIMYEGGTHAAANWDANQDERLVSFLTEFNYSDEMGALYDALLDAWAEIAESRFNAFVDVAPPSQWGSWGALRHLDDDNPRWRALVTRLPAGPEQ